MKAAGGKVLDFDGKLKALHGMGSMRAPGRVESHLMVPEGFTLYLPTLLKYLKSRVGRFPLKQMKI